MSDTESEKIIEAFRKFAEVSQHPLSRGSSSSCNVMAVPDGLKLHDLKPYLDKYLLQPERKRGTAAITTLDSFMLHVRRNTVTGSTVVFCDDRDETQPSLIAVYNYNGAAGAPAEFGDHRAAYNFPLSDEWKAWRDIANGKELDQGELAEFFEERLVDVVDPEEATKQSETIRRLAGLEVRLVGAGALQTLAKGLSLTVESKIVNSVDISSSERAIIFEETHNAKVKVPQAFAIGLRVFVGGERYPLAIRIRYRIVGGKIKWSLLPLCADDVFRMAVDGALSKVETFCSVPVFHGHPEA